ncbi:MAG: hypothetical protein ACJ8F3_07845 [Xanthobacteraceae bacterium]
MIGRASALLCGALFLGALAACSAVDNAMDPRYDDINRTTAKARNESILLNIVRASHSAPLNFVAFSRVTGLTSVSGNAALPNFLVGPYTKPPGAPGSASPAYSLLPSPARDVIFNKDNLGGSTTATNSFDISLLETKDFYQGLLRPVDLPILNYFIRQGYSRELLFWLFTESVRQSGVGPQVEFLNDPDQRRACVTVLGQERCFRHMVDVAVATGLTVETKLEGSGAGGGGKKGKGDAGAGGVTRTVARLCFDPLLAARAKREYDPIIFSYLLAPLEGHRPRCKVDPWQTSLASDTLVFNLVGTRFGTIKYEIVTRSTFGIYQFLGRILQLNLQDELDLRGSVDQLEDRRILSVRRDSSEGCYIDVAVGGGEFYCIPVRGAENTKRILSLLTQLVALNTSTLDLSITPTVRVAP